MESPVLEVTMPTKFLTITVSLFRGWPADLADHGDVIFIVVLTKIT